MRVIPGVLRPAAAAWLGVALAAAVGSALVLRVGAAMVRPGTLVDLAGRWAFRGGDDPAWSDPALDDGAWVRLRVPGSWGRQGFDEVREFAWYRLRVKLPRRPTAAEPWGVTLGKVDSAYALYAGGRALGGVGELPPRPRMEYDRHRTYPLPAEAVGADGTLVLALRVWRAPGKAPGAAGPVEGPFLAGPLASLVARDTSAELPHLALVLVFLLAGLYHVLLRLLRPAATEYGWFGLLAVLSAGYCFLRTQWKYVPWDDFLVLKKAEHLLLYVVPVVIVQFLWVFLGKRVPRSMRLVQGALLVAGAAAVLAPGLRLALAFLPWLQFVALGISGAAIVLVVRRLLTGHAGARSVAAGVVLVVATMSHDGLVDRGFLAGPRLGIFGFGVLVVGMSFSLAMRFHSVLRDLDGLTRELEQRVADRTRELESRGVELAAAYRQMEELALRDGLTGVLNRRAARERAAAGLAQAVRRGEPFALVLLDLDHFKSINDRHGHAAGDEALRHAARRLAGSLRPSDDLGRWGGEEFLVLLPGSGAAEAEAAAERLRATIETSRLALPDGRELSLTISAGVAAIETPAAGEASDAQLDELLRRADEALYRAKSEGRNRVAVA